MNLGFMKMNGGVILMAIHPPTPSLSLNNHPRPCSSSFPIIRCCSSSVVTQQQQQAESAAPSPRRRRRRLILLRHAHSSWDNPSLRDHDRPLTKSGEADAAKVALHLLQLRWLPQLILSSDALRTRQTLAIMQQHVPAFLDAEVHFISSFYSIAAMDGQTADHLLQAISKYSTDAIHTVMCMGHNKGWEEAASVFTGSLIELKTCNAALLEATGSSWEEAFTLAGVGGWKLQGIVKPNNGFEPFPTLTSLDTIFASSGETELSVRHLHGRLIKFGILLMVGNPR